MSESVLLALPNADLPPGLAVALARAGYDVEEVPLSTFVGRWRERRHDVVVAPAELAAAVAALGALALATGDAALPLVRDGLDAVVHGSAAEFVARAGALVARRRDAERTHAIADLCASLPAPLDAAYRKLAAELPALVPEAEIALARRAEGGLLVVVAPWRDGLPELQAAATGQTVEVIELGAAPEATAAELRRSGAVAAFAHPLPGGALALRARRVEDAPVVRQLARWAAKLATAALSRAVAPDDRSGAARAPASARAIRGSRPLVLVVEDDVDTREAIAEVLADTCDVIEAGTAERALARAREAAPDLVLLDLRLPDRDGWDVLAELRAEPAADATPVIVLSGRSDPESKVRGLALGASDYLAKPYAPGELVARVERTLAQRAQREHLRALAQTDALTGLANFRALRSRLDDEVPRAHRYCAPLSCLMLDVDDLKRINDANGHAAGSRAIQLVAAVLRAELRDADFAARYGGDEFVVLLPHTDAPAAGTLAERIRAALALRSADAPVGVSIGVAELAAGDDADALVRAADLALYAAKSAGRGRIEVAGRLH